MAERVPVQVKPRLFIETQDSVFYRLPGFDSGRDALNADMFVEDKMDNAREGRIGGSCRRLGIADSRLASVRTRCDNRADQAGREHRGSNPIEILLELLKQDDQPGKDRQQAVLA